MTDPIADLITRIRNGYQASKLKVEVPYSEAKRAIVWVLRSYGLVEDLKEAEEGVKKVILIYLKYKNGQRGLSEIRRISRPGRRIYVKASEVPLVRRGFGICVVSTPQGIMGGEEARKKNLGGELMIEAW